jgi:hypothetical protein
LGLGGLGPSESSSSVQIDRDGTTPGGGSRAGLGFTSGEGEWSREGLGKGLEQRLEDLVQSKAV